MKLILFTLHFFNYKLSVQSLHTECNLNIYGMEKDGGIEMG